MTKKNKIISVTTGFALGTLATILYKKYQDGSLQVWLLNTKERLLKEKKKGNETVSEEQLVYMCGVDSNPVFYNSAETDENLTAIPTESRSYIKL